MGKRVPIKKHRRKTKDGKTVVKRHMRQVGGVRIANDSVKPEKFENVSEWKLTLGSFKGKVDELSEEEKEEIFEECYGQYGIEVEGQVQDILNNDFDNVNGKHLEKISEVMYDMGYHILAEDLEHIIDEAPNTFWMSDSLVMEGE